MGLEKSQLEVGAAGTEGGRLWLALEGSDRTAMNWTNWPETVMSNSAPKKAKLPFGGVGGAGGEVAQKNLRSGCVEVVQ